VGTVNSTASTLFTGVSPGYHTVSVESPPGYVDTMKLVFVNLGKTAEVNITLNVFIPRPPRQNRQSRQPAWLRVYIDRTGSTVCIDNSRCMYNVGESRAGDRHHVL